MKRSVALAVCFIFIGAANGFAESLQRHAFELGAELSYIKYEEPGVMEEKGVMSGFSGSYTYYDNYMLKAEGRFSVGQVDYEGQLSDGTPYNIDDIDDYMLELRGLAGYGFPVFESSVLTPYVGLGYRYLNDDLSSDPAGYERESNYFYSPIGIESSTPMENGWVVGLTLEYDYFWKGIQISHLSDFSSAFNDVENDQNDGYGLRGSVKFKKEIEKLNLIIEPFIRYWDIDRSEDATITFAGAVWGYGYEPENDSTEIGIKVAVGF